MALPTEWSHSQIEIQYEKKDIARITLDIISEAKEAFDCCINQDGMALLTSDDKIWNAITVLKNKRIRMRFVAAINEGNISFCRRIMKLGAEVFHNDRATGNFQIADGTNYLCYITENREGHIITREQLFHTKNKSFANIQQCLFDNLCDKAIPAKEKIKEIERGIRNEFADTINEPGEIRKIITNLLMSAKDEILLLFPTTNTFYRAKYSGMLNLLRQIPNDVTVKVLIQVADPLQKDAIQQELRESRGKIQVQYVSKSLQKKIETIVSDQSISIAIEIKDDTKKTIEEASGPAIYSNSELTVSSCISIFDTLWIQSEFDKQNKIKQAYFQMFQGLELKEESYSRRWLFEQSKEKKQG